MDLLGDNPKFELNDREWRIHSRNPIAPPHYVGDEAVIKNSIVSLGGEIYGTVENAVLSDHVTVKKGATVRNSVLFKGVVIGENAVIENAVLDEDVVVGDNAKIGKISDNGRKISVIGRGCVLSDNTVIEPGEIFEAKE